MSEAEVEVKEITTNETMNEANNEETSSKPVTREKKSVYDTVFRTNTALDGKAEPEFQR
jgi:hypothetical protein